WNGEPGDNATLGQHVLIHLGATPRRGAGAYNSWAMQSGDSPQQASRDNHIGGRTWPWTILVLHNGHSIAPAGYHTARRTSRQQRSRARSLDISLYAPEQVPGRTPCERSLDDGQ